MNIIVLHFQELQDLSLVGFYCISTTIVGYLIPNPVLTYILNIYDLQTHFVDTFLNESKVILL